MNKVNSALFKYLTIDSLIQTHVTDSSLLSAWAVACTHTSKICSSSVSFSDKKVSSNITRQACLLLGRATRYTTVLPSTRPGRTVHHGPAFYWAGPHCLPSCCVSHFTLLGFCHVHPKRSVCTQTICHSVELPRKSLLDCT